MSTALESSQNGPNHERRALREQIQQSLQKAETHKQQLKSTDRRYTIINLVLGAIATFIAGESAIADKPLVGSWRLTTTIASVCTLGATVAAGVHKQSASAERLLEASECAAKLKALKVDTISENYELDTVSGEYRRIIAEFSRVDC